MDLARTVYSRELKIAAMPRQLQLSPKLLERWRGEWRLPP